MIIDGISENGGITSFLMIGQSNMAGRGEIGAVEPIKDPDCFMLRMGRWKKCRNPSMWIGQCSTVPCAAE